MRMDIGTKPKLKIKTIFLDIDTTLVEPKAGTDGKDISPGDCLRTLVTAKNNIPLDESERKIKALEDSVGNMVGARWPFGIIDALNVTEDELWKALSVEACRKLFMHSDAKSFFTKFQRYSNLRLYPATTNPAMIISAKLSIGGLGNKQGTICFDDEFGGEELCRGGKSTPDFFKALLEKTQSESDSTLMIGDNIEMDLQLARKAGIKQVILVNRSLKSDWTYESDNILYIKSLDTVFEFFE